MSEEPAVTRFREYLRIRTVQPDPDYDSAIEFLKGVAKQIGLPYEVYKFHENPKREIFVLTWEGVEPSLPSVVLNSHMDVVPVFPDKWKYDPFEAVKDENGDIYARGTQDMKCVGMQYLEAIWRLKKEGKRFTRTIHVTFVPDEEIFAYGMHIYLETDHFKSLNAAFFLDEGLANPKDSFFVYYGEKVPWQVTVTCPGRPGHGSQFIENNAAEKLRRIINSFLSLRDSEEKRLKSDSSLRLGDVTTVNMNICKGGVQGNVVPDEFTAEFDMRVAPTVNLEEFEERIHGWCREAGEGVTAKILKYFKGAYVTSTSSDSPWWSAFKGACDDLKLNIEVEIFPANTDGNLLRQLGYPVLGFSPMSNTPILLHDNDEFLNEKVYLRGIEIYCGILSSLASVPRF